MQLLLWLLRAGGSGIGRGLSGPRGSFSPQRRRPEVRTSAVFPCTRLEMLTIKVLSKSFQETKVRSKRIFKDKFSSTSIRLLTVLDTTSKLVHKLHASGLFTATLKFAILASLVFALTLCIILFML